MDEQVIGEAVAIAKELETRVALRGYHMTGVLFGHNQVIVQYTHKGRCGQFCKKVGKRKGVLSG